MIKWFKNGSRATVTKDCSVEVLKALEGMTEKVLQEFENYVHELGSPEESDSIRYWIITFEEQRYKCSYCGRKDACKGAYPEGCFYDKSKN